MNTDISAPCYFCGHPAQPQVHHGRPEDTSQGKGSGGDPAGLLDHSRFDLCDDHHTGVHAKRCAFRVVDGMVELLAPGDKQWVIGRRGLVLKDRAICGNCGYYETDCECGKFVFDGYLGLTDSGLAERWAAADSKAVTALRAQCEIASALKERYAHNISKWYERAAEILGSYRGKHVHWRRVYERCDLMELFGPTEGHPEGRWLDMEKLGMTVARAITRQPRAERPAALELALDLNAEFKTALEISAAIKGDPVASVAKVKCDCDCCDHWKGD